MSDFLFVCLFVSLKHNQLKITLVPKKHILEWQILSPWTIQNKYYYINQMEPWWIFNYTSLITLLSAVTDMQSAYSESLSRKNSLPRSGDRSLSDSFQFVVTSLVAQTVKASSYNAGDLVQSLGWEDPLEKEMATHSSILAWKVPWTEEPGRLQSMGSQRVRQY